MDAPSEPIDTVQVIDLRASRKALITGTVGHLIEWYEFAVYGYMGPYIAKQFFPHGSDLAGIMATFMVFAVAFFMRPIGAVVFGRLTDKVGRRPMLAMIISVMSLATAAIGILPTTRTIGDGAAVLLVICRIVQGFSGGGEMGGAVSLTVENAPPGKRGLYGSWSFVGTQIGFVCGGAVATLLSVIYTPAEMADYGWRIPFLIALPLGGIALYIRLKIDETPHFKRVQAAREASPGKEVLAPTTFKYTLGYLLTTGGVLVVLNAVGNTFLNGMPTYLSTAFKLPATEAYFLTLVTGIVGAATMPLFGWLSDKTGRRPVLLGGAVATVILSYPLYMLIGSGFAGGLFALFLAGVINGSVGGPMPAFLSERFPTRHRGSGVSIVYAVSVALFGGSAPYVITWILKVTGDPLAAAYYTMFCGMISAVAGIAWWRADAGKPKDHLEPLED